MLVVLTLSGSLAWGNVNAADSAGRYTVAGDISCGELVQARTQSPNDRFVSIWVSGYITAYNSNMKDTYNILGGTDIPSAVLWMENYCRSNPLRTMANAVEALMTELAPKRFRSKP